MSAIQTVQVVSLLGWLILVGSAYASYRLNWRQSLKLALMWTAIFVGVFLLFDAVIGG